MMLCCVSMAILCARGYKYTTSNTVHFSGQYFLCHYVDWYFYKACLLVDLVRWEYQWKSRVQIALYVLNVTVQMLLFEVSRDPLIKVLSCKPMNKSYKVVHLC